MSKIFSFDYELVPKADLGELRRDSALSGKLLRFYQGSAGPYYLDLPELSYFKKVVPFCEDERWHWLTDLAQAKIVFDQPFESHKLVTDWRSANVKRLASELASKTVKLKVSNADLQSNELLKFIGSLEVKKIRMDFNCSSSADVFMSWWKSLPPDLVSLVDVVEDPFSFERSTWQNALELGVPIAHDMASPTDSFLRREDVANLCVAVVIKPYCDFKSQWIELARASGLRVIYTHGMESAVGRRLGKLAVQVIASRYDVGALSEIHGFDDTPIYQSDFEDVAQLESLDWKS